MTPRELYVQSRRAGYTRKQATERVNAFKQSGKVPADPTESVWGALVHQESRGDQSAVSPKGAIGRAQVMPDTAPEAAAMADLKFNEDAWKNDPVYNEAIGRAYLRDKMTRLPRDQALAAYNGGEARLKKVGGDISRMPAETRHYVKTIMENREMTPRERFIELRQQGYSKEEAAAMARGQQPQAPAPQPAPAPAPAAPQAAVPAPAPAPQAAQPTPTGAYLNENIQRQLEKDSGLGRFSAGVQRAGADILTGGRQLVNEMTGDEEMIRQLKAEKQQRDALFQKHDPEGSGFSAADAGSIVGDVGAFGMLGGAGAAGQIGAGALEGLLKPADDSGERMLNAGIGGVIGSVGPIVSGARGMMSNKAPIDAAKDFTARAMGQAPGAPIQEAYEGTAERVGDAADDVYKSYKRILQSAERVADLPPVRLSNTAKEITQPLGLDDEVVRALSSKALTTINAVQGGAVKTSPILDARGRPFEDIAEHSFEDVRDTLRELKNVQSSFHKAQRPGAAKQIERLQETLEADLDEWAKLGTDTVKTSLEQARGADVKYRDEVLPAKKLAEALKAPDGKSMEAKLDAYLFGGANSVANAGTEIDKLIEVAPEVREPLRKIMASKLNLPRGEVASSRAYLGGTTAEALLTKQEREYMVKLADALQKNPNFLSVKLPIVDSVLKKFGVGSVKPYGYEPLTSGPNQKVINALRSATVGELTDED